MFFVFSVPNDPDCQQKEPVVLVNQTNTTITLGLAMDEEEILCVINELRTVNSTCRPFIAPTLIFDDLQPSNRYNFSVFSYRNTSGNPLYSSSSCQISEYTCKIFIIIIIIYIYIYKTLFSFVAHQHMIFSTTKYMHALCNGISVAEFLYHHFVL